jgi:hypothetical protein
VRLAVHVGDAWTARAIFQVQFVVPGSCLVLADLLAGTRQLTRSEHIA